MKMARSNAYFYVTSLEFQETVIWGCKSLCWALWWSPTGYSEQNVIFNGKTNKVKCYLKSLLDFQCVVVLQCTLHVNLQNHPYGGKKGKMKIPEFKKN